MTDTQNIETVCINSLRILSAEMVQKANSGHPGMPIGAAPIAHVLWTRFLKHNPENPQWCNRDRFVLSAGHASALLYSLLYVTGYDISIDQIKDFRQWESGTPGHPEYGETPGVEATTGPLGQGISMAAGMAFAERLLSARFNREGYPVVDHYTYILCSDGDLMEGVSSEAASLAGHQKLGKLICLYDDNSITIEGSTDLAFTENVCQRFEAYGWQVLECGDVHDLDALEKAVAQAQQETDKPSLIRVQTHIGYGTPLQDSEKSHGAPLGEQGLEETKQFFGWNEDPFTVPDEALAFFRKAVDQGKKAETEWNAMFSEYEKNHPEQAAEFTRRMDGRLPDGWETDIPVFNPDENPAATRKVSGTVLNTVAQAVPELLGGSADLGSSNKSVIADNDDQDPEHPEGRNFHFGVREHAMGAAVNGMALHGGVIPYGATFLVFADYCRPALRLAALMQTHVIFIFTHDSIGVGEDGPTHQPVEHLASLRAIPGFLVFRPADANETSEAWRLAVSLKKPCMLALTRQSIPVLDPEIVRRNAKRGGYILSDTEGVPDVILIGTGSEVHPCIEAQGLLKNEGISARIVSMPCIELFEEQDREYRDRVLPPSVTARVAVEAGSTQGWHKWTGSSGLVIGIDRFGASAPGPLVMEKLGFTAENIAEKARGLVP